MSTVKGEIRRGKPPRRPKAPVGQSTVGVKVIPVSKEYRENYDRIQWGRS